MVGLSEPKREAMASQRENYFEYENYLGCLIHVFLFGRTLRGYEQGSDGNGWIVPPAISLEAFALLAPSDLSESSIYTIAPHLPLRSSHNPLLASPLHQLGNLW